MVYLRGRSAAFRWLDSGDEGFPVTGLVGLWECDEASGNLIDVVGSRQLAVVGSPAYHVAGVVDYGVALGTPSSDNFQYVNPTWFPSGAFTVNQWIKVISNYQNGASGWRIAGDSSTYGIYSYVRTGSGNYVRLTGHVGSTLRTFAQASATFEYSTWYMLTFTRSAEGVHSIWRNAVELSLSDTYNDATDWSSYTPFELGDAAAGNNSAWHDQLGVWSRVLTIEEIQYLYNAGSGVPYPT